MLEKKETEEEAFAEEFDKLRKFEKGIMEKEARMNWISCNPMGPKLPVY